MKLGIDVSKWNKSIDWSAIKSSDVEFAIIRAGYGSKSPSQIDQYFNVNVQGCQNNNIPFGAYHYGYAVSEDEARDEANFCLSILSDIKCDYPVYYDVEEKMMFDTGRQNLTNIINAFCEVIAAAGYTAGVYMSKSYAENNVYMNQIPYEKWIAQYNTSITYSGEYGIWQYTSDGSVSGINGRVDMNYCYKDYTGGGGTSPEPMSGQAVVTADLLNVRAGAGTDYDVVFQVANGKRLNLMENCNNGWYHINCLHGEGYVSALYVRILTDAQMNENTIYVGTCNADILNVRAGASTDYDVVFQVANGNSVDILEVTADGWLRIRCLHGEGYCVAEFIDWPVQATGVCNADILNVRAGAGTSYDVAYQLENENEVNILAQLGSWYYIDCIHGRGYCSAEYISR
jgi:GH25 family lysozyme M1 (1,4-beta-N-acetylmuramidase)